MDFTPAEGHGGSEINVQPVFVPEGKIPQYKSKVLLPGKDMIYPIGTVFKTNNDDTASAFIDNVLKNEHFAVDNGFFSFFDPDAPWQPTAGDPFWTFDTFGQASQFIWDGSASGEMYRLKTLIDAGLGFKTRTAFTHWLETGKVAQKDTPDP